MVVGTSRATKKAALHRWGLLLAGQRYWHIHHHPPLPTTHHAEDMQAQMEAKHGQHSLSRGSFCGPGRPLIDRTGISADPYWP